jgi:transposase
VFDIMTRLKVHNMAEGGSSQADISTVTGVPVRSIQRIVAEAAPTREEVIAGGQAGRPRLGRPRKADDAMVERIRLLLADPRNTNINAMEVLRRARDWGYRGGRSQMAELVKELRPKLRKEPIVRFDGLPGEYAQFDFGQVEITFTATGPQRVHFFAGRLKYSRYMHVVLVPDETSETVARSLLLCLAAFGGSTKEWVFDNAKTIRVSPIGVMPVVLHRYIAQLVTEYNVIATFCAPRSGNQKGSVERLVGFVKNSFFRQRSFRDLVDLDVSTQRSPSSASAGIA